jgi:zinc protease
MRFLAALLLVTIPMFVISAEPNDPAMRAAAAFFNDVRIETLGNGLQVVLKKVPGSGVVTTMMTYKVGASDEELDATGLSHYLEHLMFKGTEKMMPGDVDRLTQRNGGHNNAWTSEDLTCYHFDFAADRWEVALDIEADRMRNIRIDAKHEFEQEKGAVISELHRNEDGPFDLEQKAILPRLFGAEAPYGHPVIGLQKHVEDANPAVIKGHYDRWYHPNNAVFVICGDFDPEKTLVKVRAKFESIPRGNLPGRKIAHPVSRAAPERHEFTSKFEVARMLMGFNGVKAGAPDEAPLDVVQEILTAGRTGRLYRALVEDARLASSVRAGNSCGRYPGWFELDLEMLQGKPREQAENMVLEHLTRLANEPVGEEELQRAKRVLISNEIFGKESVHNLCQTLARGIAIDGLERLKNYLPQVQAVTADDVRRVAKKYLDVKTRVVVWSIPKEGEKAGGQTTELQTKPGRLAPAAAGGGNIDLNTTQRVVLPNGLTLLLLENHRLPIVSTQVFVRNVRFVEPADKSGIATLAGSLLEEGTTKHSGREIANLIENVGGQLNLTPSGGSLKVLAPDLPLGIDLLFDCLTHPAFPQDAFDRVREQTLSAIEELEMEPDTKAAKVFKTEVYGPHPLGWPSLGTKATVSKLTADDCRAFHRSLFAPNSTIVAIVGDFDAVRVQELLQRVTADWKPVEPRQLQLPPVTMPDHSREKIISMPESVQLYFYMGHAGIRRADADYYKLRVMDYVLGTGTGFTDRLSARLRDRMGLAYTVSANITDSAGEEPGMFACYIGTRPNKFNVVKDVFLEELKRIRTEVPEAREVEDAKSYLLGSLPFRFASSGMIAEQLLQIERFGLGFNYLEEYRRQIGSVTPEDVRNVARKYLDPERMIGVAAGPVDEKGLPLKK